MAPGLVHDDSDAVAGAAAAAKPTVYVLDKFQPAVIEYVQDKFNAILPGMPGHEDWRAKAQYLLIRSSYLTAEDVENSPNLIAVGKQGVGIDKIDAKACAARGIKIFNTPGVNARAVAELALTLACSVARCVGTINRRQNAGQPVPKETCSGLILHKRPIGVIGMGNIGKTVATIFRGAYEAPIIAYDPYMPADAWSDLPHTRVSTVEELLRASDIVSVHVPLTESTRNLISMKELKLLGKEAIVINTARGGIINEADLETAVKEGIIWGAGLDCHEQEPPTFEKYSSMWQGNILSTPHIGAATEQTQIETGMAAARYLYEFTQSQSAGKGN
ncbi:D-isomer specific 2-hydroxyacid dehydrogenase [Microdochium trichocladiopsis]|uniref:D-isomer specific 2-hydroxyacid dehydrogenase n=1 Tax=Microdochium trichocladiopsis TaxID=1682393 RepID=A0A9P8Y7D9_9PEZI|nr:D-isomer specific 2-hydroxyacid dehydrogenase [Microdochium trichocladiopsis]KAH7031691.1 D-isomer specific 2-hydroxyacid dehydrogenase [Microdochium trichocladiopsis]